MKVYSSANTIFKDRKVLDENYIPPELRVRSEEAEILTRIYMNRLFSNAGQHDIRQPRQGRHR